MADGATHRAGGQALSTIEARGAGGSWISFAVFGTCLVRTAGAPSEVVRAIGRLLAVRLGIAEVEPFAEDFVEWRREAEQRARWRSQRGEPRLAEIWAELKGAIDHPALRDFDGCVLELEVEREMLRPVERIRARIFRERELGRRILFLADSSLPAEFIKSVLRHTGLAADGDPVYVSSELGFSKRNGTLFRHVLELEKITAAKWHHVGDESDFDCDAAVRLGIRAEAFPDSRPKSVERLLLRSVPPRSRPWLTTAGALIASRLTAGRDARDAVDKLIEQFLGPFLCVFGHWILRRASEDGCKRLYFASRDGRLLHPVCRCLAQAMGSDLDLRYLYISRQAVLFPAIEEISPADLPWLRRDYETPTLTNLLAKLELNVSDCEGEWHRFRPGWGPGDALKTPLDWAAFWKFLQSPPIRARIFASARIRLANAQAYFASEGLRDRVPAGFVDLGWFLTCQAGLHRICGERSGGGPLRGYYLGLKASRLGPAEAGEAVAIFREGPDDLPAAGHLAWLPRHYLIEQVAGIADHPSVRGYGPGGEVEFVTSGVEPGVHPKNFHRIEEKLIDYAGSSGAAWHHIAHDDAQTALFLGTLLNEFFTRPSRACIEALQEIALAPDPQEKNGRLIRPYTWSEALRAWLPRSRGESPGHLGWRWWPQACAVATPRGWRAIRDFGCAVQDAAKAFRRAGGRSARK